MKKHLYLIAALLLAALVLSGCGGQKEETAAPAEKMTLQELVASVAPDAGELAPLNADDLADVLGIEMEDYTEFVYLQDDGLGGREILALRCPDESATARVAEKVEKYLEQRRKETQNYLPEVYQLLTAAQVETRGNTVALITGEGAQEQVKKLLAGE